MSAVKGVHQRGALPQVGPSEEPQGVEAVMADWGFKDRHAAEAFRRARSRKLSSVREQGRLQALQVCTQHFPLP